MNISTIVSIPMISVALVACSNSIEDKRAVVFSSGLPDETVTPITKPYPVNVLKLDSFILLDENKHQNEQGK